MSNVREEYEAWLTVCAGYLIIFFGLPFIMVGMWILDHQFLTFGEIIYALNRVSIEKKNKEAV